MPRLHNVNRRLISEELAALKGSLEYEDLAAISKLISELRSGCRSIPCSSLKKFGMVKVGSSRRRAAHPTGSGRVTHETLTSIAVLLAVLRRDATTAQKLPPILRDPGIEADIQRAIGEILWVEREPDLSSGELAEGEIATLKLGKNLTQSFPHIAGRVGVYVDNVCIMRRGHLLEGQYVRIVSPAGNGAVTALVWDHSHDGPLVLLVRSFRYPLANESAYRWSVELPRGFRSPNDHAGLDLIQREVIEEAGVSVGADCQHRFLGHLVPDSGKLSDVVELHLLFGSDTSFVHQPPAPDDFEAFDLDDSWKWVGDSYSHGAGASWFPLSIVLEACLGEGADYDTKSGERRTLVIDDGFTIAVLARVNRRHSKDLSSRVRRHERT